MSVIDVQATPTPNTPLCSSCVYWDPLGDGTIGACRRNAPPVPNTSLHPGASQPSQMTINNVYWPVTSSSDWCGEYSTTPILRVPSPAKKKSSPKSSRGRSLVPAKRSGSRPSKRATAGAACGHASMNPIGTKLIYG